MKWLGAKCEAAGIDIYPGFAGDQLLVEGNRVVGVRIGDMGVDKNGKPKANYQPGMDIFAKVTVLGEGVRGSLTKQLDRSLRPARASTRRSTRPASRRSGASSRRSTSPAA